MSDTFTGETYDTLCMDAEGFLTKESPEQARELLLKAISLIGTRPRARSLLADTCMSIGLWAEARSQLEILITLEEGNTHNNFRLAQVLEELGEYQLAYDNYSVVLEKDKNHHSAGVALQRIAARSKESGIDLAGIFGSSASKTVSQGESPEVAEEDIAKIKEGTQVFLDVPGDSVFAESESEDENSIEKLLKNIGITSDGSSDDNSDDISKLLRNIGVSTSDSSDGSEEDGSSVSESEEEESSGKDVSALPTDLQAIFVATSTKKEKPEESVKKKPPVPSLDEIFGTLSSTTDEGTEGDSSDKEAKKVEASSETPETPAEEPDVEPARAPDESEAPVDEVIAEEPEHPKSSGDTLQSIFSSAEANMQSHKEETPPESEVSAGSIEVLIGESDSSTEEEQPAEEEEPVAAEADTTEEQPAEEEEPAAVEETAEEQPAEEEEPVTAEAETADEQPAEEEEPVAVEETAEEQPAEEKEPVVAEAETEEEQPAEEEEPIAAEAETEEEQLAEEKEPVAVEETAEEQPAEEEEPVTAEAETADEQPAEEEEPVTAEAETEEEQPAEEEPPSVQEEKLVLNLDAWSPESGLLTAHLTSGSLEIQQSLLTVYEGILKVECGDNDLCRISGSGTFLLNCGPEEPLILDFKKNMTVRLESLLLSTGIIRSKPVFPEGDDSLVVLEGDQFPMQGVFTSSHPVRVILLGRNSRTFFVRTSSIIASDPGIAFSDHSPEGYTMITGEGKVYLIE